MKALRVTIGLLIVIAFLLSMNTSWAENVDPKVAGECMTCHKEKSPGLYQQWYESQHAFHKVTCINCHQANKSDSDAFEHYGAFIATLVTPTDCGECHEKESEQFVNSYHATAAEILDSKDAYLAHVAGGEPVAIIGCEGCHGSKVKIDENSPNKLDRKSFPNSGIGRLNPDGSKGSCSPCHTRHALSKAQARQPEACSKCHLGPDHPQKEIYEESKHGNIFFSSREKMNLDSDKWVVGESYNAAPTCASCHISATKTQEVTHEIGDRIAWTLRPIVSKKLENWEQRRSNMKDVCITCHSAQFTDGHYYQFDASVELYNDKFARPSLEIITLIKKKGLLERPAAFSNKIEWIFWELWHHEGRRARHGAAMMGPDYTWWHGFYEVAQHFYFKFLPEARKFNDPEVNALLDKIEKENPMHNWLNTPTSKLKEGIRNGDIQDVYKEFYDK
ncbi:MAG: hypothetical protein B6244_06765 [Candidatus Cloacimonetes bacterium 4572_55]|nr:MAG: hypothetical protein B6244_06765 [Candidatus Cloacimonetes bacterium 4572_55]